MYLFPYCITWVVWRLPHLRHCFQCGYASKSCFDTWEIYLHRGHYKLVIIAFPDLGSPCLIESLALLSLEKCFESFRKYISESLGILLLPSPFIALVRHPDVEFWLFSSQISLIFFRITRVSWNRSIDLWREHCSWCLLSFRGCGSVPGSWVPRCCRQNFIVADLEYLSSPTLKISFMQLLVRKHRCYPVLRWVREYCHDLYNGCFSKVEVDDFRRFLGYVLKDGYSWM